MILDLASNGIAHNKSHVAFWVGLLLGALGVGDVFMALFGYNTVLDAFSPTINGNEKVFILS